MPIYKLDTQYTVHSQGCMQDFLVGGEFSAEFLFATIARAAGGGAEAFGAYNSGIIIDR